MCKAKTTTNTRVEKLLAACVGGLITFGIMYVAVVGQYVSRTEASQMIAVESPYIRDAKWIEKELSEMSKALHEMGRKIDQLLARD